MAFPDSLQHIVQRHAETPYFRLLYVGNQPERWDGVRAIADEIGCFESVQMLSLDELRENAKIRERRMEFGTADTRGCLIEIWDVADAGALNSLPLDSLWSPQSLRFGVAAEGRAISFRDFIAAINKNFARLGSLTECAEAIGTWMRDPFALRLSCTKKPSVWLRNMKHDYFDNVLPRMPAISAELGEVVRATDFWQDAVRNVLAFPFENSPARKYDDPRQNTAGELVVPRWMDAPLTEIGGWRRGDEFTVYDDRASAARCVDDAAGRGRATAFVQDCSLVEGEAFPQLPRILVGDPAPRMSWPEWNAAFSSNVLGAFSKSEFLGEDSPHYLPPLKTEYWKTFCPITLPNAVECIVSGMAAAYGWLETLGDGATVEALRASTFRCLAQVLCARRLYFGNSAS